MLRAIALSITLIAIGVVSFMSLNSRSQEVLAVDATAPPAVSSCGCSGSCGCGCTSGLACNCQR